MIIEITDTKVTLNLYKGEAVEYTALQKLREFWIAQYPEKDPATYHLIMVNHVHERKGT